VRVQLLSARDYDFGSISVYEGVTGIEDVEGNEAEFRTKRAGGGPSHCSTRRGASEIGNHRPPPKM
jgi:hypothetical protein